MDVVRLEWRSALPAELMASSRERFEYLGATPDGDSYFASIETALVLDPCVATELPHELRRLRICLPVLGGGHEWSDFAVRGEDLVRWGVWTPTRESIQFADWERYLARLEARHLLEDRGWWRSKDEFRDPRIEVDETPRRMIRLLPVPLETNRRRPRSKPRSNKELRKGVATFVMPSQVFEGERLKQLGPVEFMVLMATYALTDMRTFGGADPAHVRVEDGSLVVSDVLVRSVLGSVDQILTAVLDLEQRGFLRLVPVRLQHVDLPGCLPTVEVIDEDAASDCFTLRPTVLWHKEAAKLTSLREDSLKDGDGIVVTVESEWPLRLVVRTGDKVPQMPQYEPAARRRVFSDRPVQCFKLRLARGLPDLRLHRSEITLRFADDRDLGLVHMAKATLDAMRESKTITGDSKYVVDKLTIQREDVRDGRCAHVSVEVDALDEDEHFSRRLYLSAPEWKPPARRGPAFLSACWPSYAAYKCALQRAVSGIKLDRNVHKKLVEQTHLELAVHVSAPSDVRFDPDNVALLVVDLLALLLGDRDDAFPVDRFIDQVIVTHSEGQPSATLELRPL